MYSLFHSLLESLPITDSLHYMYIIKSGEFTQKEVKFFGIFKLKTLK